MIVYPMRKRIVSRAIRDQAARRGDKPFLLFEDRVFSYADFERITNRVANGLRAVGIAPGEHVAMLMNNCPEQLWLIFGLIKLGAVAVPVNTAAKGELLHYYIDQSDSIAMIVQSDLVPRYLDVQARSGRIRQAVVVHEGGAVTGNLAERFTVPVCDYADLANASDAPVESGAHCGDLVMLSYTSGTTGPSKGNMHTHAFTMTAGYDNAQAYGYREDDVLFTALPLFHGNAFLCCCIPALLAGATVAVSRRFSASSFWDEVRRYGVTQFNSLGAMTNIIWSQPERPDDAQNTVRQCMVVPTPREFYHGFEARFGLTLVSLYALTDFGMVTLRGPDEPPEKWASAGRVRPEVELRIVDDEDFDMPRGETGEIVVRHRDPWMAALGYYNMTEATLAAFRNLWFHTGDRGFLDADGYLYFVDRKKDAIRRRGENISSYEVEQIVMNHPAVADVAAYPVTSDMSEDEVMVSILLRPGAALTPEALIDYCQDNMAYFMVPRYVEFPATLPRTASEKVQKYKLREAAEADLDKVWDREKTDIVLRR